MPTRRGVVFVIYRCQRQSAPHIHTDDCSRHSESPVWIGAGRRRRGSALVPEPAVIAVVTPFRRVEEGAHPVPARHGALLSAIRQRPPRLVRVALTGDPVGYRSPNRTAAQAGRHRALVVRAAAHPRAHGGMRRGGAERTRRDAPRRQRRRSSAVHSSAVQSAVAGSTLNLERARLHRLEKRLEGALIDPAGTLATLVPTGVPSLASKLLEHGLQLVRPRGGRSAG